MQISVMSFNVQHFSEFHSKKIDYPLFAEAIRSTGADVVGLNETYAEGSVFRKKAQAETVAQALGWHWYFAEAIRLRQGGYGNSIISKYPLTNARTVPIPDPKPRRYKGYYETRCVLRCTAQTEEGPLEFAVTHFGLNPDEQKNAVDTVSGLILPERFVLMGDFNVRPGNPALSPIRDRLADTADAPGGNRPTFPADAPDRKIDYIFVSKDVRVLSADVPELVVSDHRPYLARIEI